MGLGLYMRVQVRTSGARGGDIALSSNDTERACAGRAISISSMEFSLVSRTWARVWGRLGIPMPGGPPQLCSRGHGSAMPLDG